MAMRSSWTRSTASSPRSLTLLPSSAGGHVRHIESGRVGSAAGGDRHVSGPETLKPHRLLSRQSDRGRNGGKPGNRRAARRARQHGLARAVLLSEIGLPFHWRIGPASLPVADDTFDPLTFTPTERGLKPWLPAPFRGYEPDGLCGWQSHHALGAAGPGAPG